MGHGDGFRNGMNPRADLRDVRVLRRPEPHIGTWPGVRQTGDGGEGVRSPDPAVLKPNRWAVH